MLSTSFCIQHPMLFYPIISLLSDTFGTLAGRQNGLAAMKAATQPSLGANRVFSKWSTSTCTG